MNSYSRLDEVWQEPFANWQQPGLGLKMENSDLLSSSTPISLPQPITLDTTPDNFLKTSEPQKPALQALSNDTNGRNDIQDALRHLQQRLQIIESTVVNLATETKSLRNQNNTDLYTFIAVGVAAIFVLDTFANKK